ncbi:hypothetical protein RclHR1_08980001 [Rhizophagus clarus]|uniref:Crinkler effector protein N-terminal domain-containing protein n=1 Tax=Rhizophagus clarus TaxID=94130 RepID=A0A2Z6S4Y6_9GLOM|nr:hypothetical protein RclHR1_08980001 [Rhizophagus clarus]
MAYILLWFQFESAKKDIKKFGVRFITLEDIKELFNLSTPAESLILKAKKNSESQYTVLDSDYLCNNDFKTIMNNFDISWSNPIIVTESEVVTTETKAVLVGASTSTQSNKIWFRVRHDDESTSFAIERTLIENIGVSCVSELISLIKIKSKNYTKDKDIIIRKGNKDLNLEDPISELYNTENEALEVITDAREYVIHENEPDFRYASIAFDREFEDNSKFFIYFQKYIDECHRKSKDTYMPYLTVLQSSGYGKSRLVKEYANYVYTLYLNLGIDRNCFPRPSVYAKHFIDSFVKSKDPQIWFNTFLAKAVSLIKEKQGSNYSNPSQFWVWQLSDNGKSIWKTAIDIANMHEILGKNDPDLITLIRSDAGYLRKNFNDINSEVKILLCIDEGRTLLEYKNNETHMSLFRCWRRALRDNRWRARGLFSVILDTTSRLSNFAPSLRDDPTIKSINDSRKIFMPFIDITTFNILTDSSGNYYNRLFSKGRPCWKALKDAYCEGLDSEENDIYAWDKVIDLVKAKVQGGGELLVEEINMDESYEERKTLTSVAILASLCSVDISPSMHFASNLIGSHLGTCLAISQDRMKVLVCYPPEPLITEAVYKLLNNDILHCIAQTLGQGIVEPGKRGEVVGELILILTRQSFQRKRKNHFYAGEIKLIDFLDELLFDSKSILQGNDDEHNVLKNANISFTRFVTISTIPTRNDLAKGYETGVAFNLKRNQRGADFLIPIRMENKYTFWIIQIKNHNIKSTNYDFKTDATSKLTPRYVFEKSDLAGVNSYYLAMYWQLGAHNKRIEILEDWGIPTRSSVKNPTIHYAILSLKSFKVAHGKTLESLRAILSDYINPYDEMWSYDSILGDRTKYIETFLPWCSSNPDEKLLLDKYNDAE